MSEVLVFDRAMCCSTGVCGPQVDPVLPRFAADLEWLKEQGHSVTRFNLAHDAAEYAAHERVQKLLSSEGTDCLPLILVDGQVVSRSEYPQRENLALWTDSPLKQKPALPISNDGCCGGSGCC
ncbi:arsenite efflux transporter metallochaperone ArsD [Rhodopirellula sp. MGV]|uniref:arsenite efflux transporter metallochaperone ArsD n=1 Tax=Rhodopirellula sp. MGV TaxID=2023130 RepID=UPI000B96C9E7|nr:arsenite efflux transporter metallochaperone ArsD [Rhodopirellula sp. MGV]OYP37919.1 arsenical resistance operon transcriptional repressor ArsD [Rhodopirellula sp. MGV]PNY37114.1 arsenical resistance operon transcriptional repressor ArsD [Rhodopirellula baltica]